MKFSLVQSELFRSLQLVAGVVPAKTPQPHLTSVLVQATQDGQLRFTGTDLDAFLVTNLHASVEEPGVVAVPARRFLEVVRELPGDVVEVKSSGSGITIQCGRGKFRIMGPDPEEFPPTPEMNEDKVFAVSTEILTRLIQQSAYAASSDFTRPEQTGVYAHVVGGDLRFVATNGHRLALSFHAGDYGQLDPVLLPNKTLNVLQRLVSEARESISISASKRYCLFNLGSTRLYSRLLDGPFPPYQQAIPADSDKTLRINREAFMSVLRRVGVFSEAATHMVKLHLESGVMNVSATSHEVGEADEALAVDYDGGSFRIGFNGAYILDLLKTMSCEDVDVRLKEPTSATVFQPVVPDGKPDLLCLVMPLRLPEETPAEGVNAGVAER